MTAKPAKRKIVIGLIIALIAGALTWLAFGNIGKNLVYYWTPTELHDAGDKAFGALVRLGGQVKAGTMKWDSRGSDLRFVVTDGKNDVSVVSRSVPPQMFREGIGVVVEGRLDRGNLFQSQRLLVKHDNEYQPPKGNSQDELKSLMKNASDHDKRDDG